MNINKPERPHSVNRKILRKHARICALVAVINKYELKERTRVKVRQELETVNYLSCTEREMKKLFALAEYNILEILKYEEGLTQGYYYRLKMAVISGLTLGTILGVVLVIFNNYLLLFLIGIILGACPGWVLGATLDHQTKKDQVVLNWSRGYFIALAFFSIKRIRQQLFRNF